VTRFVARLVLVLVAMGIVLSPLRAVAATIPMLFAYDVAAQATARAALGRSDAVRPQRGGRSEYAYDAVHVGTMVPPTRRGRRAPERSVSTVRPSTSATGVRLTRARSPSPPSPRWPQRG